MVITQTRVAAAAGADLQKQLSSQPPPPSPPPPLPRHLPPSAGLSGHPGPDLAPLPWISNLHGWHWPWWRWQLGAARLFRAGDCRCLACRRCCVSPTTVMQGRMRMATRWLFWCGPPVVRIGTSSSWPRPGWPRLVGGPGLGWSLPAEC